MNGSISAHGLTSSRTAAVFLAGGIGITPFLAMARHAVKQRLPHRLHLFYANRRPEDAAFLPELQKLEQLNRNYRLIAVMTEPEKSAQHWSGETATSGASCWNGILPTLRAPSTTSRDRHQ